MVSSDGDQSAPATRTRLTTLAGPPLGRTLRAPELSLELRPDALNTGARAALSHASHHLYERHIAVPAADEPRPNGLDSSLFRQAWFTLGHPAIITPMDNEYVSGFTLVEPSPPERTPLVQLCRENNELVTDLARYAEGLCTEAAVRRKYKDLLDNEAWTLLGTDDLLVEMVEAEKLRRIRNGSFKRERAQQHITRAPDVLAAIMDDPRANHRHKVDAIKSLDALADNGPKAAAGEEKVFIRIDLTADTRAKGQAPNPEDVITIEATPRPSSAPKQIEDDHSESDEWRR